MSFKPYVAHGWKICRIKEGDKGPRYNRWNYPGHEIPAEQAEYLVGAGLMHAYSGTCAVDIDSIDLARPIFAEHGVDLDALLAAEDSVQIDSGRADRAKLLYALPEPLYTYQHTDAHKLMVFELRCKSRTERTTQDVLPPSVHPKTKKPYQWKYGDSLTGDWRNLPPLPPQLRAMWEKLLGDNVPAGTKPDAPSEPPVHADADPALRALADTILATTDPDCDYTTWVELGMALEGDLGQEGWALWNAWSAKGSKYPGEAALESHWNSFGNSPTPLTLHGFANKNGVAKVASRDMFDEITDEELIDNPFAQADAERVAAMKLWTLAEIQARPWPTWIVRDILPKAELSMVYGASGAGKSFLVLDIALAVARGVPWWDHDVRQGGVLWLAAEAFGSMKPRTRAYAQANGLEFNGGLYELPFYVVEQFNLNQKETVDTLIAAAKDLPLQLVVVDTLAAASGGANENSGEDMGAILDACRSIHYATGASVVLIHHSGKNAELGARGWSGIRAAVQAELRVDYNPEEGTRSVTATKQRDGIDGIAYSFDLVEQLVGIDDREQPIMSASVKVTGKLEHAPSVEGDGNGKRPPKNVDEALVWTAYQELAPLARDQVVERGALVMEAVRRCGASADEAPARRKSFGKAIGRLGVDKYFRVDGDFIHPIDTDEDESSEANEDGYDLL